MNAAEKRVMVAAKELVAEWDKPFTQFDMNALTRAKLTLTQAVHAILKQYELSFGPKAQKTPKKRKKTR